MPPQTLALALAASIYPPALAAVIALGRGAQLRSRVSAFVLCAFAITYATGTLMLLVLIELGATGTLHWTPSAALDLALGVVLFGVAVHLRRGRQRGDAETPASNGESKIERYLQSRRLACLLGLTLYVLPSPIYIAAVKTIADANYSTAHELLALAVAIVVMLWVIEVPMAMLLAAPARASATLERINVWFIGHGRLLAVLVSAGAGAYLTVRGLVGLIG